MGHRTSTLLPSGHGSSARAVSRLRSLAAALLACASLACSGGSGAPRATREVVDLFPTASIRTHEGQKNRLKLMAQAKTDRLSLLRPGEVLRFEPLELPARATLEASVQLQDAPRAASEPLVAHVGALDVDGTAHEPSAIRLSPAADGDPWTALSIEIEMERPIRALTLAFTRGDLAGAPAAVIAVLRPVARFELERAPRKGKPPRQVLLVTTDTLRADALGVYGNPVVQTPHLDALAADGFVFEQCYSVANVTNPSHTSILASLYPKDHKVLDNFTKLSPDVPTMLEPLRAAGFRTAAFVSSFNFRPETTDFAERFDEFHGCDTFFERRAEDVNAELLPWLGAHAGDDFFVWAHYFDAHMPYAPPHPFDRMYPRAGSEPIERPLEYKGNLGWYASDELGPYRALYQGEVSYLDHELGALFDRLRELDLYDDALVIVVSDHGESLGEHGVYCDHSTLFDEVTRVPLIVKPPGWPRRDAGPVRVPGLVSTVDLYPTIFELQDLPVRADLRGHSLAPIFSGAAPAEFAREHTFSSFARGSQESVRTQDHLFLLGLADEELFPSFSLRAGHRELYRVAPNGGLTELTSTSPDVTAALESELRAFLDDARDYEALPIDPEAAAGLENLGYTK